jgi:integrase
MPRKRKLPDGMVERPGRKGYYADFRAGGRRIQRKLGTDFEAARSILNDLRGRAERAGFNLLDNNYSANDLRDAYMKRCKQELRPGSAAVAESRLNNILGWLAVQKVSQITPEKVLDYRAHRLKKVCPGTVNHNVGALKAMLAWGTEHSIIGSNPIDKLKPLLHDRPKDGRPLEDDEVGRLLERSTAPWRDMWYAYLVTGMRQMELAELLFRDIDWESRELIVRTYRAKNHRERRVPIEDGLWDILKRQAETAADRQPGTSRFPRVAARVKDLLTRDHVFVTTANTPLSQSTLYRAFIRYCGLAEIQTATFDPNGDLVEHVDVHSLRRTFATNAITNGADPKSVQEILGHRTLEMTMRIYTKIKGAPKRQAVTKLSYGHGATAPAHVLPLAATNG